jgi:hypothetical protein
MPWSRQFSQPIILNDGRTIVTLDHARATVLTVPPPHRRGDMWRYTSDLLKQAATDNSSVARVEAEAQFLRALKAEGLL